MRHSRIWALLGLALLLAGFFDQLRGEWGWEGYYFYGWGVPVALVWFLVQRARTAPVPAQPTSLGGPGSAMVAAGLMAALVSRWLLLPSPHWRLALWAYGAGCVLVLLGVAAWAGGRRWVVHFSFPALFLLVAIPWPTGIEQGVIDGLTRSITVIVTGLLHFTGFDAVPLGHTILLSGVRVEVGDACSGIRSLQALLALALFLGEVFFLTARSRMFLVVAGAATGLAMNLLRSAMLAWLAALMGPSARDYHDVTSAVYVALSFAVLYALAGRLPATPGSKRPPAPSGSAAAIAPVRAAVLLCGALAVFAIPEWIHAARRPHPAAVQAPELRFDVDRASRELRSLPLAEETAMLRSSSGWRGGVVREDGRSIEILWFEWDDTALGLFKALGHTPEFCMGCQGASLLEPVSVHRLSLSGTAVPVEGYRFLDPADRRELHVFRLLWNDGPLDSRAEGTHAGRLRRAWEGRRRPSGRVAMAYAAVRVAGPDLAGSWTVAAPVLEGLLAIEHRATGSMAPPPGTAPADR